MHLALAVGDNGAHARRDGPRRVRGPGRPGARRHPRRARAAGAQRRRAGRGRAAAPTTRRPARAVRRRRAHRAVRRLRRGAARPDLHLPQPAARHVRRARRSSSTRSGSPSCTRSPTTSASTTTGCTTSATPDRSQNAERAGGQRERRSSRAAYAVPRRGPSACVCTANAEYVVSPPQKPMPSSARRVPVERQPRAAAPSTNEPGDVDQRACPTGNRASRWCAARNRSGAPDGARRGRPAATVTRRPPRRRTALLGRRRQPVRQRHGDQAGGQRPERGTPRRGPGGRRPAGARPCSAYADSVVKPPSSPGPRATAASSARRRTTANAGSRASANEPTTLIANVVHGKPAPSGTSSPSRQRRTAPPAPPAATTATAHGGRRTDGSPDAGAARLGRVGPRQRCFALLLADELAEEPVLEVPLLGRPGQREQPLLAAEGVGEVEQLEEAADRRGGRCAACRPAGRSVCCPPLRRRSRSARRRCPRAGRGRASRTGRRGSWRAGSRTRGRARAGAPRGAARGSGPGTPRNSAAGRRGRRRGSRRPAGRSLVVASGEPVIDALEPSSSLAPAAGTNQTTLPSSSISAPQAVEQRATMPRPRPKVSSRSSLAGRGPRLPGRIGGSAEPS